jgi:S-adenosyl-L-methionine hydrolase (adenosine-forming)
MRQQPPIHPPILTLLTDFGLQDEYVAVLKGVILCHCPDARIIDLSHLVPPQSIATAMFLLNRTYHHFPAGSVHLVIVDPEVGTERAILALAAAGHIFIGPDNGLFTPLLSRESPAEIYRLDLSRINPAPRSTTFHGRDIMAPVAAQVAGGMPLANLGWKISANDCRRFDCGSPRLIGNTWHGEIVHIDAFGNLCSNLHRQELLAIGSPDRLRVVIAGHLQVPLVATYASASHHTAVALFDSNDFLEIACNQGHAAEQLGVGMGTAVSVMVTDTVPGSVTAELKQIRKI